MSWEPKLKSLHSMEQGANNFIFQTSFGEYPDKIRTRGKAETSKRPREEQEEESASSVSRGRREGSAESEVHQGRYKRKVTS